MWGFLSFCLCSLVFSNRNNSSQTNSGRLVVSGERLGRNLHELQFVAVPDLIRLFSDRLVVSGEKLGRNLHGIQFVAVPD